MKENTQQGFNIQSTKTIKIAFIY